MALESTHYPQEATDHEYPYLGQWIGGDSIILWYGPHQGVFVFCQDPEKIGKACGDWYLADGIYEHQTTYYRGSVTIEQS